MPQFDENLLRAVLFNYVLVLELFICESPFFFRLKRRENFAMRFGIGFAAVMLLNLIPLGIYREIGGEFYGKVLVSFSMLAIMIAFMVLAFDESMETILFCAMGGKAAQQLANKTFFIVRTVFDVGSSFSITYWVCEALVYALAYALMYLAFSKRIRSFINANISRMYAVIMAAVTLLVTIVMNSVLEIYARESQALNILCSVFYILCCLFILVAQSGLVANFDLRREKQIIKIIRDREKAQYKISKDSMELINIKYHDLRHQLSHLASGKGGENSAAMLESINHSVAEYDASVQTGNEDLDVVLTEKSLYCAKEGINLTCMADGKKISFMSPMDIYSLFGNILDNAIEAVEKFGDEDKRDITLVIKEDRGFIFIQEDNYYREPMEFVDGLPQTTKKDKAYHGFGMRSIEMLTQKYGGVLTIRAEDGVFRLNITFQLDANCTNGA